MKNLLFLILLLITLSSCTLLRNINKNKSQADSTSVRLELTEEGYFEEIIRKYALYAPDINKAPAGPIPTSGERPDLRVQGQPLPDFTPTHYLQSETTRRSGKKQVAKKEEKQAQTSEKTVERDYSPMIEKAIFTGQLFLAFVGLAILLLVWAVFFKKR